MAVLIDGSTVCWFEKRLEALQRQNDLDKSKYKNISAGVYYQLNDLALNVKLVGKMNFPRNIPVVDMVSGTPPFDNSEETEDWRACYQTFVQLSANRSAITAEGCGHYIYRDNPLLVINTISQAYASQLSGNSKTRVLNNTVNYTIDAANDNKKAQDSNRYSENDLNS